MMQILRDTHTSDDIARPIRSRRPPARFHDRRFALLLLQVRDALMHSLLQVLHRGALAPHEPPMEFCFTEALLWLPERRICLVLQQLTRVVVVQVLHFPNVCTAGDTP